MQREGLKHMRVFDNGLQKGVTNVYVCVCLYVCV